MCTNTTLKKWMDRYDVTPSELGAWVHASPNALNSKLSGQSDWRLKEMQIISALFSVLSGENIGRVCNVLFASDPEDYMSEPQQQLIGGNE